MVFMNKWHKGLLKEYKEGRRQLREMVNALDDETLANKEDKKVLNSAIRDMDFVIEWLETGILPEKTLWRTAKKHRAFTYNDEFVYGVNGYYDESMGGFITMNNYSDPYIEIDNKIDRELEESRNDAHCKYDTKTK